MPSEPLPEDLPAASEEAPVPRILVGYDGSLPAATAIEVGASLFPRAEALIVYLWSPSFTRNPSRHRLAVLARSTSELIELVERESEQEAERLARIGVAIARAARWTAEPLVLRTFGGKGLRLAALAEERKPDLVLVGSRGMSGTDALLGSVSDLVVHHSPQPVLVVPHPLFTADHAAAAEGPVLVGWDGSDGARNALTTAARLFPRRALVVAAAGEGHEPGEATSLLGEGNRPVTPVEVEARTSGPGTGRAVADALAACARDRGAGLIVLGSRGCSAIRKILLGSVAMATLHHAHLPVMVVPEDARRDERTQRSPRQRLSRDRSPTQ